MATWENLKAYIGSNYKVAKDEGNSITLVWNTDGGRSQVVLVRLVGELGGEPWAEVTTGVAKVSETDPTDLLKRNNHMIAGALAILDDIVVWRHTFPLGNLDPNEFETPLHVAVNFGDALEKELTGGDTF